MLKVLNPGTGEVLKELIETSPEEIAAAFDKARRAQPAWAALDAKKRARILLHFKETLLNHTDELVEIISKENGKPKFEALSNEVLPSIELIKYFARKTPSLIKDRPLKLSNPIVLHRKSYLNYWPMGVVAVISPWNYPLLLPMGEIVVGLLTGNAIIFKPSEVTPIIGLKIQELLEQSGLPPGLLQTVVGGAAQGQAIIEQKPAKIFFTGSVETGKKIAKQAAENLIPVNLELGGKDPMIVLPDADLDFATSAALWGGFSNSGQVCASTERILVHEKIAEPFLALFKEKAEKLKQGHLPDDQKDLGFITYEKQKQTYEAQIQEAKSAGAEFVLGGEFSEDRRTLKPTIVTGDKIESLSIYKNETFGPVVAVTRFKTLAEAAEKANRSNYGLLASIITRNISQAETLARQLEAGTVTINEVTYTAGLPETPWGGVKETGSGKKHSDQGVYEFVHTRHIHKPRFGMISPKSIWWFPYTPFQFAVVRTFMETYRSSWIKKLLSLPPLLWNFLQFLKNEKRY